MVKGTAQLHRRFAQIPEIIREEVAAELEKQANLMVRQMKALAPKGSTRKLVDSIGWTWGDAPKGTMSVGTIRGHEYGKMKITLYAGGEEAFYARFQEFGTKTMPASPFFFPVFRAEKRRVKAALSRAVTRAAKRA